MQLAGTRDASPCTYREEEGHHPPCWVVGGQGLPATQAACQEVQPSRGLRSRVRTTMA